eukprot:TRINITY_DN31_c1_g2_i1.p1 TRINITY_DN31_c1_g2~~TRINITY_DN31_c1_g2_i1.p1  ORF type:complete len:719 (-),score=175.06 TRINITY_DN31_c1_g2_i1:7-2163(-)
MFKQARGLLFRHCRGGGKRRVKTYVNKGYSRGTNVNRFYTTENRVSLSNEEDFESRIDFFGNNEDVNDSFYQEQSQLSDPIFDGTLDGTKEQTQQPIIHNHLDEAQGYKAPPRYSYLYPSAKVYRIWYPPRDVIQRLSKALGINQHLTSTQFQRNQLFPGSNPNSKIEFAEDPLIDTGVPTELGNYLIPKFSSSEIDLSTGGSNFDFEQLKPLIYTVLGRTRYQTRSFANPAPELILLEHTLRSKLLTYFSSQEDISANHFHLLFGGFSTESALYYEYCYTLIPRVRSGDTRYFNRILSCLSNHGKIQICFTLFKIMDELKKTDIATYNIMMTAGNLSKLGDLGYQMMGKIMSDGLTPDSGSFNALISVATRNGRVDEAMSIYEHMRRQKLLTEVTYGRLLQGCGLDEEAGYNYVSDIMTKIRLDKATDMTQETWQILLSVFARNKGMSKVIEDVFDEYLARGFPMTPRVYSSLIEAYSNSGQWDQVGSLLDDMHAAGFQPTAITWKKVLIGAAKNGQKEVALHAFNQIQSKKHGNKPAHDALYLLLTSGVEKPFQMKDEASGEIKTIGKATRRELAHACDVVMLMQKEKVKPEKRMRVLMRKMRKGGVSETGEELVDGLISDSMKITEGRGETYEMERSKMEEELETKKKLIEERVKKGRKTEEEEEEEREIMRKIKRDERGAMDVGGELKNFEEGLREEMEDNRRKGKMDLSWLII